MTQQTYPSNSTLREHLSLADLDELVRDPAAAEGAWAHLVRFGTDGDRWWTRLHGDDSVDVWLLTWLPGQATDLHDHGDSAAAFAITRGRLEEVRAQRDGLVQSTVHQEGEVTWVPAGAVHDVAAVDVPAVSIHAYSPPLRWMTYFDVEGDGRLTATRLVHRGSRKTRETA
jgi:quercetin dioxygenase-like cupin family protein